MCVRVYVYVCAVMLGHETFAQKITRLEQELREAKLNEQPAPEPLLDTPVPLPKKKIKVFSFEKIKFSKVALLKSLFDCCCIYYSIRNSPVALLEALFARLLLTHMSKSIQCTNFLEIYREDSDTCGSVLRSVLQCVVLCCCDTLPHAATHCNTLRHTVTHCNTLPHTATQCNTLQHALQHTATHCNTLQHAATHCNTLQHTAIHTVTHCNTLQHTATHCNTLQCTL